MTQISYLLFAGIAGMVLLALAIIAFFIVYQQRLLTQQDELRKLEKSHQQELLNASIVTQEKERERIAKDLHDSIGGSLSTTKLFVHHMQHEEKEAFQALKSETAELLDETIQNIRNTTRNLLPVSLEQFGLVAAITDLAQRHQRYSPVGINFYHHGKRRFKADHELAIYRIVQELINNTLKHASAKDIHIDLAFSSNHLKLNYRDDGVGFNLSDLVSNGVGIGLKSIQSRVAYLEAQMEWHAEPGNGFQFVLEHQLTN